MRRNIRPLLNNNDVNCCCLLAIYYFRENIAQYVSYLNCIIYSLQQTKLMVIRLNYEKTRLRVVKQFAHSLIRFKSFWCKCEREFFFFTFRVSGEPKLDRQACVSGALTTKSCILPSVPAKTTVLPVVATVSLKIVTVSSVFFL